ncbi:MAG: hypothetical protein LBF34_02370 [Puniceicoccales bacterium]|jgi:ankyrin repeat protein|nr:hypothetical protein [Puniceicoccales bacterium]
MQYKGWICGGILYGMEAFLLCGITGAQEIEKDDEAQVVETDEDSVVARIDRTIEAMSKGNSEKALQLIGGIEDKDIDRRVKIEKITSLGAAVFCNLRDVAEALLERGADPNMKCFDPDAEYCVLRDQYYGDCTPLGMLTDDDNDEMMKLLIKHGADVNVLIRGHTLLQRVLSDYGYYFLNEDGSLSPRGDFLDDISLRALYDRCNENILREMQFLIENGANVNTKDEEGDTILHNLAGDFSHGSPFSFEIVDLLFRAGADPRIANNKGKLPLQKFKLLDHVVKRFPERTENYNKIGDMFQQRIDELNAQGNKSPEE